MSSKVPLALLRRPERVPVLTSKSVTLNKEALNTAPMLYATPETVVERPRATALLLYRDVQTGGVTF